jgi:hypothetical protein
MRGPMPVGVGVIYTLERVAQAFVAVLGSSRDRLVFQTYQ